jgi:L-fuconolactonase
MLTIDAHQHFWHYQPTQHAWIDDAMAAIRRDFLPADLQPVLQQNGVDGCVAVQADQTEAETDFLVELATANSFIKGVVGWVDLRAANIAERLEHYSRLAVVKGFRHVLQGEEPAFMLQPAFVNGISKLNAWGFTYDILIFPQHLQAALQLVQQFPQQRFVIDHIAKPYIKKGDVAGWDKGMQALAAHDNVYCKVSGMVTEADYCHWKQEQFTPYLDVVLEAFGTNRLLYGSDWPVCLVAANYAQQMGIVKDYFSRLSLHEQQAIFGGNAITFYGL